MPRFLRMQLQRFGMEQWNWRNWLTVGVLLILSVVLLSSLLRVLSNARTNYEVYLYEKSGLDELEGENERLQRELAYYESSEYKKLYAREHLNLVEPGERLYKIVDQQQLYQVNQRQRNFFVQESYWDWWAALI